ncbi:MAG: hypothetical protein GY861_15340 [bacterium]|nr:hypothetical protein [bacterium]
MQFKVKDVRERRKKWMPIVGRFILAFGDIENVTYFAIKQLPVDKIYETSWKLNFGTRVDLVLELVNNLTKATAEMKEEFRTLLIEAKQLSVIRNTVAHSPLMLMVYQHKSEEWAFVHEESLANIRNAENSITIEKLTEYTDRAEVLATELYESYQKIYQIEDLDESI